MGIGSFKPVSSLLQISMGICLPFPKSLLHFVNVHQTLSYCWLWQFPRPWIGSSLVSTAVTKINSTKISITTTTSISITTSEGRRAGAVRPLRSHQVAPPSLVRKWLKCVHPKSHPLRPPLIPVVTFLKVTLVPLPHQLIGLRLVKSPPVLAKTPLSIGESRFSHHFLQRSLSASYMMPPWFSLLILAPQYVAFVC